MTDPHLPQQNFGKLKGELRTETVGLLSSLLLRDVVYWLVHCPASCRACRNSSIVPLLPSKNLLL